MELNRSNLRMGKQNMHKQHAIGIPIAQLEYALLPDPRNQYQLLPSPSKHYSNIRHSRIGSVFAKVAKIGEFANGIREHVRLGSKLSVTVKGKLSLGAKILQVGGVEQVFEQNFSIMHDEKLLKASQCYLSTTVGPIAGLLFVSNHRVAFSSERSIKVPSLTGKPLRAHYKVTIPLGKIKRTTESVNVKKSTQKYVQIVTEDNFEFWFMGFLNHRRTLKYIHQAIHQVR